MTRSTRTFPRPSSALYVALIVAVGCGERIAPLDPHDVSLPERTRQLVAESQDAAVVARAERRARRHERKETLTWRDRFLGDTDWSEAGLKTQARGFADAREALAEARVREAEAALAVAEARLSLIYAEQAVRLDRAHYDLPRLRERVEALRAHLTEARKQARAAQVKSEQAASRWWLAYGQRAQGRGAPLAYWTRGAPALKPAPRAAQPKKPHAAAKPAAAGRPRGGRAP